MNYEIVTPRWSCGECHEPVRLFFSPTATQDETNDEFVCDRILCAAGHAIPDEIVQEIMLVADQEFYAAFERGSKAAEVWVLPEPESDQEIPT